MSNSTSLFGKWLVETKGISLEDYANRPVTEKRRLEDEFDAQSWAEKSRAAAAEAARVPENFWAYLRAVKNVSRDEFEAMTAQQQLRLTNEHGTALAEAKKALDEATRKPTPLPDGWDSMSASAQLAYLNKRDLVEKGYVRE